LRQITHPPIGSGIALGLISGITGRRLVFGLGAIYLPRVSLIIIVQLFSGKIITHFIPQLSSFNLFVGIFPCLYQLSTEYDTKLLEIVSTN
jgi:hypothetical protein